MPFPNMPVMNSVKYSCTALAGVNKVGNLKADEHGYREVVLGALNVFNSQNMYYGYNEAKHHFEASSLLMRRIKKGCLKGEYGHPKWLPGWDEEDYANRLLAVWESETCCHIADVSIDMNRVKDQNGRPIIAIIGRVCPSGPKGDVLERSFQNPEENVCFSIRSFTNDVRVSGVIHRHIKNIVTWDCVTEPGLAVADKWHAPALESFEIYERTFTRGVLQRAIDVQRPYGAGMESSLLTAQELFHSLGWALESDVPPHQEW